MSMPWATLESTGKTEETGRRFAGIPWSAILNKPVGGLLALSSGAVWTLWPASASQRILLVVVPLVWFAIKLRCRRLPDADLTGASRSSRNWKMGLTAFAALTCGLCWYAWSFVWLSGVPHLAAAPLAWRMMVYFYGLLHQSILPWPLLAVTAGFPLIVWFFGDSWLELFLGITTVLAAGDAVTGTVPAPSAWNFVVLLCALLFLLRGVREVRAGWSLWRCTAALSPLATSPVRSPGNGEARVVKQFCSSVV